jgi:tRNA(adenine34) deaminase
VRNPEEQFMREALKEAQAAADAGEVPVGAVIVCQQYIVAKAHNFTERLHDPTAHAEMQAITAATHALGGKYLHDCTLVVTLEPCVMCAGALFWTQIGKIIYGASDPKRGFTLLQKPLLHPKTVVESGLLQEECAQLLSDFFKQRR